MNNKHLQQNDNGLQWFVFFLYSESVNGNNDK